jgi:hypothetical protein
MKKPVMLAESGRIGLPWPRRRVTEVRPVVEMRSIEDIEADYERVLSNEVLASYWSDKPGDDDEQSGEKSSAMEHRLDPFEWRNATN